MEGLVKVREQLLAGANETKIQAILKQYPQILGGGYRTGHGTWGFSEIAFPPEYRADWIAVSGSSAGLMWDLIELEDPQKIPFKENGHYSESARKGIEQIKDWRNYIQSNLDYVTKPKAQHGLGLYELRPKSFGIVVVGRNELYASHPAKHKYDEHRKRTYEEEHIEVMSYDSFLSRCMFEYSKPPLG